MSEQVKCAKHEQLGVFLQGRGFSPTLVPEGELLIVRLPAAEQERLLADESLRKNLAAQARALGFARIALELL